MCDYTTVCKSIGLNVCGTLVCLSVFSALSKQTARSLQRGEKCAARNISLVLTCLIIFGSSPTSSLKAQLSSERLDSSRKFTLSVEKKT